ncbi:MAG: NAD-dependent deacylase [Bacteroidetes bacterium]|nr:MAG: NAD-dependent deacylase [Bacteroidota bacterium]
MSNKAKVVVLTGAGVSAESGIKTFRDSGGLWEEHDVMDVASIEGWYRNKELVLEFYNARRRQLKEVSPNAAHEAIKRLESRFDTVVVTQNVDDLHERAGSSKVIHLHGELKKVRSTLDSELIYEWDKDLHLGDRCEKGAQLRPHIVWFGESVPMLEVAAREVANADVVLVIGTSMQVYPAAGLIGYAPSDIQVYYIDPNPAMSFELQRFRRLEVVPEVATIGVPMIVEKLLDEKG